MSWKVRHAQTSLDFLKIKTAHLILARHPDLLIVNKKKTCQIVDFAVPPDHRVKLKESEKKDKCLDLVRELNKLWNMRVAVIPILIVTLGTDTEELA